jgi:hypothetical protein
VLGVNLTGPVLTHGPLEQLTENLCWVQTACAAAPLGRVLTVARLSDGRLVLHNPIALDAPTTRALEAFGEPAFLVVPNRWHGLDTRTLKQRYPAAWVLCPAGARRAVAQHVAVGGTYHEFAEGSSVRLLHLDGTNECEGVMLVRSGDGATLVFGDAVVNLSHAPGLMGLVYRLIGLTGGPRTSPLFRLAMVQDRRAFCAHLRRLADTPALRRIVVGRGAMITVTPAATLHAVAAAAR